jgi:hypothetical protein
MADDEQKTEHINLKVAGQDGSVVQFKIKKVFNLNFTIFRFYFVKFESLLTNLKV